MLSASPSLGDIALMNCFLPKGTDSTAACPSVYRLYIDREAGNDLEIAILRACGQLTSYYRSGGGFVDLSALPPTLLQLGVSSCAEIGFHTLSMSLQELTVAITALAVKWTVFWPPALA